MRFVDLVRSRRLPVRVAPYGLTAQQNVAWRHWEELRFHPPGPGANRSLNLVREISQIHLVLLAMLSRSSLRALRLPVASTSRLTRQIALQSAHHPTASAPPLDHAPVDTTTHPQFHPSGSWSPRSGRAETDSLPDSRKALEKVVLPPPAVWAHSTPHLDYALHHPVYTPAEVNSIEVVAHSRDTTTDKVASGLVGMARWGFDFVTRYKHASPEEAAAAIKREGKEGLSIQELTDQGYIM